MSAQNAFTCALPFMLIAGAAERAEYDAPVANSAHALAAILDAPIIEKIFTHLGLQARAPPRASVRGQLTGSFAAWNRGQRRSAVGRPAPVGRVISPPDS